MPPAVDRRRPGAARRSRRRRGPRRSSRESAHEWLTLRAAQRGDRAARDRIVEQKLGLVRTVATRYKGYGVPLDDLVQEGAFGLLRAIDTFDPARSPRFDAYAHLCVRRAIANALSDQARLIRLPRPVVERRRAVAAAERRLAAAGLEATAEAIACETGLAVGDVTEARDAAVAAVSLDQHPSPDGPALEALVADPSARDPALCTVDRDESDRLRCAVTQLPERKRRVVVAQWGLDGRPSMHTSELARRMHLSAARTQEISRGAICELRRILESGSEPAAPGAGA